MEHRFTIALLVLALAASAAATRTKLTFDYNWRFKLGDPAGAIPALQTASLDPSFANITGSVCSQLAWSQLGRMGERLESAALPTSPLYPSSPVGIWVY